MSVFPLIQRFLLTRHFALLWTGQTVSTFGSYVTMIGLPILARLLLHASNTEIGLLTAFNSLPGLLLGLFIGVWVDRLPRRPLMLLADFGRAGLLTLVPLLTLFNHLHILWLYIIVMATGLLTLLFEVASLSFLPTVLSTNKLAQGNSRLGISTSLAEIVGPPLAGLLIQLLTVPIAILLDMLSFLFSAFCMSLLRVAEPRSHISQENTSVWVEIREGLDILRQNRILRAMATYICTQNLFGGSYATLYLLYTLKLFGANPLAFGLLVAMGGVGSLIGSFCANYFARAFGMGRTLVFSALFFGVISFGTPLAQGPLPLIFTVMALSQLIGDTSFIIYNINEMSLRQTLVPGHLLGRINVCLHILANCAMPIGALLAGLLSEVIGIRLTLLIGSCGMFLAAGWLVLSPLWHYKQLTPEMPSNPSL